MVTQEKGVPATNVGTDSELWKLIEELLKEIGELRVDISSLTDVSNPGKPDEDDDNPTVPVPPIPWWTPGDVGGVITGSITDTIPDNPVDEKEKEKEKEKEEEKEVAGDIAVPLNPDKTIEQTKTPQIWDRFPFCIPYDFISLISALNAKSVTPKIELPFKIEKYKIDYTIVIDFAEYESVLKIARTMEVILFILGLILVTRNMIRG